MNSHSQNILFADPLYLQMTWVTLNCKSRFTSLRQCLRQQLGLRGIKINIHSRSQHSLDSHSPGLMLTNSSLLRTSPPLRRPPPSPSLNLSAPSPPSWGRWGLLTRSQSGPTSSARGQSQVSLENELCVLVLHMMTLFYRLWRSMKQKNLPSWKLLNSVKENSALKSFDVFRRISSSRSTARGQSQVSFAKRPMFTNDD